MYYYVAKQAERQWGVYYTVLGNSKLDSMHRTRKAAVARCSHQNAMHRIALAEAEARRKES